MAKRKNPTGSTDAAGEAARSPEAEALATALQRSDVAALLLVGHAYAAWLQSGLGYLTRASLSWSSLGKVLTQQVSAVLDDEQTPDTALRVALDESMAQLRELGEASVQEALALQKNLLELSARLRDLDKRERPKPHRAARPKP